MNLVKQGDKHPFDTVSMNFQIGNREVKMTRGGMELNFFIINDQGVKINVNSHVLDLQSQTGVQLMYMVAN